MTWLEAVGDILQGVGETAPSTLTNPDQKTQKAKRAVQYALHTIYQASQWEWRLDGCRILLVLDTAWYALPDRWGECAFEDITVYDWYRSLRYKTYNWLCKKYPWLQDYAPGMQGGSTTIAAHAIAQLDENSYPLYWTIQAGYVGVIPAPKQDFVDEQGDLIMPYHKKAPTLVAESDDLEIPEEFEGILYDLAVARLKRDMNYDDWHTDYAVGREQLETAKRNARRYHKAKYSTRDGVA